MEKYLTRRTPGVVFGDPTDTSGLRIVAQATRWLPTLGSSDLSRRYSDFWRLQGTDQPPKEYPLVAPSNIDQRAIWQRFSLDTLGFVPQANTADPLLWSRFLTNRYSTLDALNTRYQTTYTTFEQVPLVDRLPADTEQAKLLDWYQFEGVVLSMSQTAHQFTVLLPTPSTLDVSERQRRLDIATRIIQLEKPAHTSFSIKFYWSFFRIGEARLGIDTLLGQGSRAPQLLPPLVVDQEYLAESYLAPGYREDSTERQLVGRERLKQSYQLD